MKLKPFTFEEWVDSGRPECYINENVMVINLKKPRRVHDGKEGEWLIGDIVIPCRKVNPKMKQLENSLRKEKSYWSLDGTERVAPENISSLTLKLEDRS